jgi:glutamyl-Q tRNA(Asp) synthetase
MPPPVYRFAPSPNGYLHLGHALSAWLNAEAASATGGRLLLRIEDIDRTRCRPEFEQAIYEDLAWLGIAWDRPVRRQSEHLAEYGAALERLRRDGLVYPAFESRAEIAREVAARDLDGRWPRDPDGVPLYPWQAGEMSAAEQERLIAGGAPWAWRLDMRAALAKVAGHDLTWREHGRGPSGETGVIAARPQDWGDVILGRKDTPASYHLAVALDDAFQGVTDVVRGQDLFWSTSVHRLLQALLGLPSPDYRHHGLVRDAEGRKLSKSTAAVALRELRAGGSTPAAILQLLTDKTSGETWWPG